MPTDNLQPIYESETHMGYYIQTPVNRGKADWIINNLGGTRIPEPASFKDLPQDKGLVVVVSNPGFDAAAYAYSQDELNAFRQPNDPRSKTFILLDRAVAELESGFRDAA